MSSVCSHCGGDRQCKHGKCQDSGCCFPEPRTLPRMVVCVIGRVWTVVQPTSSALWRLVVCVVGRLWAVVQPTSSTNQRYSSDWMLWQDGDVSQPSTSLMEYLRGWACNSKGLFEFTILAVLTYDEAAENSGDEKNCVPHGIQEVKEREEEAGPNIPCRGMPPMAGVVPWDPTPQSYPNTLQKCHAGHWAFIRWTFGGHSRSRLEQRTLHSWAQTGLSFDCLTYMERIDGLFCKTALFIDLVWLVRKEAEIYEGKDNLKPSPHV